MLLYFQIIKLVLTIIEDNIMLIKSKPRKYNYPKVVRVLPDVHKKVMEISEEEQRDIQIVTDRIIRKGLGIDVKEHKYKLTK